MFMGIESMQLTTHHIELHVVATGDEVAEEFQSVADEHE